MRPKAPFAAMLLLLGSGQITACRRGSVPVQITETAAGQSSRLSVGETLEVILAETPTTGFRWRLVDGCAGLLSAPEEQTSASASPPGAPGEHRWSFLARTAGTCELHFASGRAWEATATGKTLVFPVVVAAAR